MRDAHAPFAYTLTGHENLDISRIRVMVYTVHQVTDGATSPIFTDLFRLNQRRNDTDSRNECYTERIIVIVV